VTMREIPLQFVPSTFGQRLEWSNPQICSSCH
jgi:hypothetical protein